MIKDLIDFFKNAPLEETTYELEKYNIEFIEEPPINNEFKQNIK